MAKHKNRFNPQGQDNKNRSEEPKTKEVEASNETKVESVEPKENTPLDVKVESVDSDVGKPEALVDNDTAGTPKESKSGEDVDKEPKENGVDTEEDEELDDNGKVLKNAIGKYIEAVTTIPEAKSAPIKESMLKTIVAVFKRPDLTQRSADIVNKAFKEEVHCAELPLLRGLNPKLHNIVSFIHAKLEGINIGIEAPIGNAEKIK